MQTDDIIAAFAIEDGEIPREAIKEARARRDEMIPAFIAEVEKAAAPRPDPSDDPDDDLEPSPLLIIVRLLAEWEAREAYRPVCAMLHGDEEDLEWIFGDTLEDFRAILPLLFDGDTAPIEAVVLDDDASGFVRWACIDVLVQLAVEGRTDRAKIVDFIRAFQHELGSPEDDVVWIGWQQAVVFLGIEDLAGAVRENLPEKPGLATFMTAPEFDEDLARALAHPDHPWPPSQAPRPLTPLIELLEIFAKNAKADFDRAMAGADQDEWGYDFDPDFIEPATNPYRSVGRNDPCPCGSGKKFKKCCLGKVEAGA
ncbi:DUF1186 domain-containing protein [Jiella pelagia]|uniref:DUF1186 domain-containing protein n=1 Tax=Jiella pelagia TaxID=2986949 RepID=A0ABY7C2J5_9HYPH|nr:DUF1186 domain-containing protein [Jiella pelagia]WAP70312.1 DUF1186 domain-containing protein [Jiella pelagia]